MRCPVCTGTGQSTPELVMEVITLKAAAKEQYDEGYKAGLRAVLDMYVWDSIVAHTYSSVSHR